ncbi:MAG: ABC transporter ATP-binding protein [Bellilinea sp.]|nr:MAG: ABC transporter ATP-binding protein [Bellilinea sp.]
MRYLVLRTENLTKEFHRRPALCEVTLEVDPGEVFGLLGPSGSGKSTLLHILLDFIRPSHGQALVLGMDCQRNGLKVRRLVGYLPQNLTLPKGITVGQLLERFASLRGGMEMTFAHELAARFQLNLELPCDRLSPGERRKIGLVQAFMHRPELILLDEPSRDLDTAAQRELYRLIAEFRAEGRSVVMASQSISEMERICDRVAVFYRGRIIAVERGAQLRARAIRKIEMRFANPINPQIFMGLNNINQLVCDQNKVYCTVQGDPDALLKTATQFRVLDIISQQPSLEEVYQTVYGIPAYAA